MDQQQSQSELSISISIVLSAEWLLHQAQTASVYMCSYKCARSKIARGYNTFLEKKEQLIWILTGFLIILQSHKGFLNKLACFLMPKG